jgi:hypothetical protein
VKFRYKLANWISGGRITFWQDQYTIQYIRAETAEAQAREQSHRAYVLQERLNRIAAMETPNANATVRRMAKLAREAINV